MPLELCSAQLAQPDAATLMDCPHNAVSVQWNGVNSLFHGNKTNWQ